MVNPYIMSHPMYMYQQPPFPYDYYRMPFHGKIRPNYYYNNEEENEHRKSRERSREKSKSNKTKSNKSDSRSKSK